MLFNGGPQRMLAQTLQDFTNELSGLRDGDERAIHQSRVAIRRLRESLAVVRSEYDEDKVTGIEERLTRVFKALGRARDADIAQRLIQHVEARLPLVPAALGYARASTVRRQLAARRRIIKTLEAVGIDRLPQDVGRARRPRSGLFGSSEWRETLRLHLENRASDMGDAMERSGGVYFRRRTHDARMAIKQFRYALELAEATGLWSDKNAHRALRKAQDALGGAHDREIFIKALHALPSEGVVVSQNEVMAIEQFLNGEISDMHQKYLATRPRIREVCAACVTRRRALPVRASAMAVAALALPVVIARRKP